MASSVVRGYGAGFFGNIAIGIVGSLVGNWIFTKLLKTELITDSGLLNDVLTACVGAVVLLLVIGLVGPKRKR